MLFLATKVSVNGKTNTGGIVLNTEFVSELKAHTSGSQFKYHNRPGDRRGGYDKYVVSESVAIVLGSMNAALNAIGLTLGVYPDNDSTQTEIATVFNADDIIAAYPHTSGDRTKSWVLIDEKGGNVRRYLNTSYYVDILDMVRSGATTTTSTTSTTSTTTSA